MNPSEAELVAEGLARLAEQFGICLSKEGLEFLHDHISTLWVWNRKVNLVGDLTVESAIFRHYGESLFLASFLSDTSEALDYGSGAGFPGVGLVALFPGLKVTLLEARQKRAAFLREAFRGAKNASVWRGEGSLYPGPIRTVVSRAVNVAEVVDFAASRRSTVFMLLSEVDAIAWREKIDALGGQCAVDPVPWRPQSWVLRASSLDAFVRSRTRS